MGAIALAGNGLCKMFVRSLVAAMTHSTEEGNDMVTWVGSYASVLIILSGQVAHTQTL